MKLLENLVNAKRYDEIWRASGLQLKEQVLGSSLGVSNFRAARQLNKVKR